MDFLALNFMKLCHTPSALCVKMTHMFTVVGRAICDMKKERFRVQRMKRRKASKIEKCFVRECLQPGTCQNTDTTLILYTYIFQLAGKPPMRCWRRRCLRLMPELTMTAAWIEKKTAVFFRGHLMSCTGEHKGCIRWFNKNTRALIQ